MSGVGLKDAHVSSLTMALLKNTNVRSLYLQYNDITDKGAQVLADFVKQTQDQEGNSTNRLASVNLASNNLTKAGIDALLSVCGDGRLFKQANFKGNPGYTRDSLIHAGSSMRSV